MSYYWCITGVCFSTNVSCCSSQHRGVQSPLPAAQREARHPPGRLPALWVLGGHSAREPRSARQHQYDPHFSNGVHWGRTIFALFLYVVLYICPLPLELSPQIHPRVCTDLYIVKSRLFRTAFNVTVWSICSYFFHLFYWNVFNFFYCIDFRMFSWCNVVSLSTLKSAI